MLLEIRASSGRALFQTGQSRLPRNRKALRLRREYRCDRAANLLRAAAAISPGRAWTRPGATARPASQPDRAILRSAADLVCAIVGSRYRRAGVSASCRHPTAYAHVPRLALAECVAAPDPQSEPALREPRAGGGARPAR